jgi:hypothetical protein
MLNRRVPAVVAAVLAALATVACGALLDVQNPNGHLTDAPADADPAVRFDGSMTFLLIADSPTLQWGTADYVILVVARFGVTLGSTNQALFEKVILSQPYPGPVLFVNGSAPTVPVEGKAMAMNSGDVYTASNQTDLNDAPHLFGTRRSGGMLEVRVDGAPSGVAVGSSLDVSAPGMPVSIGQEGYVSQQGLEALNGDIAEEIAVEGALSDSALHTLECYLLGKYGI